MEKEKCKKLILKPRDGLKSKVIVGLITKEDDLFLYFKTAKKEYRLAKTEILSLEDTNEVFRNDNQKKD